MNANNKKRAMIMAIVSIVLLIALILILALGGNSGSTNTDDEDDNGEPTIVVSDNKIVTENLEISDIDDPYIVDQLYNAIYNGECKVYTLNNRTFAVLSCGEGNEYGITYTIESSMDGKQVVYYDISEEADNWYSIIEFSNSDVEVEKYGKSSGIIQGFARALVFKEGDTKIVYDASSRQSLIMDTLLVNGIYVIFIQDDQIETATGIPEIEIYDCTVLEKVAQSRNTFKVQLDSGDIVEMLIDDINIDTSITHNFRVTIDELTQNFKAEELEV